jgi:hypothetical protein
MLQVRTVRVESRFNLVDLAGSERVKRSGVTGVQQMVPYSSTRSCPFHHP